MHIALVYLNNDKLVSRGVGYLAMAVLDAGHKLDLYDTAWMTDAEAAAKVVQGNYDVLMLSATSLYARRAYAIAAEVRRCCPCMTIIVGGIHATIARGEMLEKCPAIDYICVGEGEEFVVEFLDKLARKEELYQVKNLGYRDEGGQAVINSVRPCTNLKRLKPFQHGLFNPKSVVREAELVPGFTYVFATRGCPFSCTYCCNAYWLKLYGKSFLRTQSVDTVVAELLDLKANYPASKLLYFGDEMILFDTAYCTELFTRIHQEVQMPYGCMCRVECITPAVVDLLRETGCRYVGMGIECGDEQFRREFLNRHMTNEQMLSAFRSLRAGIPGIWLTSYNMYGYPVPYDDRLTESTIKLNRRADVDHSQMTWFRPLQGTKLYDYCVARGLIDVDALDSTEDYFNRSVLRRPPVAAGATEYPLSTPTPLSAG
jgi:anaerobic magnesium-protoporphyrin IX monomethyl ester cyclase